MDGIDALRVAIESRLRSGEWNAGQRLPTERSFAARYGVSRATVRRVLADFKAQSLIRQVVGSGTYVGDDVLTLLPDRVPRVSAGATSPAELMEARLVLEPRIVEAVVANATAVDFARMDLCCEEGESVDGVDAFEHWDGKLHEVIAAAAHNAFVANIFRFMNQVREQGHWGELKRCSATAERRVEYAAEHRAIVAALKARDADAARRATSGHLLHVRRNLLGY